MGSNRYSLDSHINLTSQGCFKNRSNNSSSVRSSSLTNNCRYQLCETSSSLPSNNRKLSKPKLNKGSLQNTFSRRLPKDSPSTNSGTSSINSLFIMNRVRSFTWKLRRRLIQTSIETESIPPEILYPSKIGVSLDNFIIFHNNRSGSCDASAISMKHSSNSVKTVNKQRNSSIFQNDSKNRLRHSVDSSLPKKDIICSHDDFKSIMYSVKEKRNLNKASLKRENFKNSKRKPCTNSFFVTSKLTNFEESIPLKEFPNSLSKFNLPYRINNNNNSNSPNMPRRSLSDGSLHDLRKVTFEIGETVLDFRTDEKASLLAESSRLDEIAETDKEILEKSLSQESIYNFTLPNIQILGDAIQQHLKVLMSIQFGDLEKSPVPSSFELTTSQALIDRIFNNLKLSRLNCCC